MKNARTCAIAVAAAILIALPARAQLMGNAPYQPSAGSAGRVGIGVGMSPGYRQAILNSKLLGQQQNPLVRDANGFLLTVDRSNSQAFLRVPNQPFLVPTSGAAGLSADGVGVGGGLAGNGLGWGGADGYRGPVYLGSSASVGGALYWIGMLNEPSSGWPWSGVTSGAASAVPMSAWIAQLGTP
jgi:hypothetical protein